MSELPILTAKSKLIEQVLRAKSLADLPWTQIFEFFLTVLPMCFPTAGAFRQAKQLTFGQKAALGAYIRKDLGIWGYRRVDAVRTEMVAVLADTPDEEMEAAWLEAQTTMNPVDFSPL